MVDAWIGHKRCVHMVDACAGLHVGCTCWVHALHTCIGHMLDAHSHAGTPGHSCTLCDRSMAPQRCLAGHRTRHSTATLPWGTPGVLLLQRSRPCRPPQLLQLVTQAPGKQTWENHGVQGKHRDIPGAEAPQATAQTPGLGTMHWNLIWLLTRDAQPEEMHSSYIKKKP